MRRVFTLVREARITVRRNGATKTIPANYYEEFFICHGWTDSGGVEHPWRVEVFFDREHCELPFDEFCVALGVDQEEVRKIYIETWPLHQGDDCDWLNSIVARYEKQEEEARQ